MPKVYNVSIYLDINTVSCPGVWLCPKGKAFLKICLFGVSDLTKEVDPFFPLVFKERFHFQKVFKNMNSVYELHDKLGRSIISLELLQCPIGSAGCVKLALFNALLSDILHPYTTCFSKPLHTSGLELLFTACKVFPGIIAPKADVSTKVMVTDSLDGGRSLNIERLRSRSVNDDDKRRQNKVCHTKNNTNCRCFKSHEEQVNDVKTTDEPNVKAYRSVEAAESEEGLQGESHDIRENGHRKTGRGEALGDYYGKRETVHTSYDKKETGHERIERGDVGDPSKGYHVSQEGAKTSIGAQDARRTGRPTTVPEEHGSWRDDRGKQENIPSSRYRQDDSPHERRDEHQQKQAIIDRRAPGESRQDKAGNERYGPDRNTSCERLLEEYDYDEMRRTKDKGLRERYFRCFQERLVNEKTTSQENRKRGEASKNDRDFNMTSEPQYQSIPEKTSQSAVDGGCTCLHSYNKKFKKSRKTTRGQSSRQRQDSREKLTSNQYDLRHTGTSVARTTIPADKNEYGSRKAGIERELPAGQMPPRSEYRDQYRDHDNQPQRIRSRSDMDLYDKRYVQRYGDKGVNDKKYSGDQGKWKSHDRRSDGLHTGAMPTPTEYRDQYRDHDNQPQRIRSRSDMELYDKRYVQRYGGKAGNDQKYSGDQTKWKSHDRRSDGLHPGEMPPPTEYRDQYREYREPIGQLRYPVRPPSDPETQGGRGDRDYQNAGDNTGKSTRPEPEFGQIPVTRAGKVQPERINRNTDNARREDGNVMPPSREDNLPRVDDRPHDARRQRSPVVLPTKRAGRPTYASSDKEKPAKSSSEHSDSDTSEDECKCPLCKNYQEMYKPKTHPCPRFRKTTGISSKVRHSKSNTGPKKLIPSRRSTVTKTYMDSSKKLKTSSNDRQCGFANCDSLDHELIGNRKDIRKFYRQT